MAESAAEAIEKGAEEATERFSKEALAEAQEKVAEEVATVAESGGAGSIIGGDVPSADEVKTQIKAQSPADTKALEEEFKKPVSASKSFNKIKEAMGGIKGIAKAAALGVGLYMVIKELPSISKAVDSLAGETPEFIHNVGGLFSAGLGGLTTILKMLPFLAIAALVIFVIYFIYQAYEKNKK